MSKMMQEAAFVAPVGFSRWASVLISVVVFVVAAVSFLPANTANGLSMSVSRHESHVTELYFVNAAQSQPSQVARGGQTLPISFTVRNLESQDLIYVYRISFTDSLGTVVLGEGLVALSDQQSQTVTPNVTVPAGISQGQVQVTLVGRNESINYWLERTA